jgi:hypothetical protein
MSETITDQLEAYGYARSAVCDDCGRLVAPTGGFAIEKVTTESYEGVGLLGMILRRPVVTVEGTRLVCRFCFPDDDDKIAVSYR